MELWYEDGKWVDLPPIETLRLHPQSTNGHSLASTTGLDGAVASPTTSEMQWLSSLPPPVSTQPHTAMFQSVQLPQFVGHAYNGDTGFAPHSRRHWQLPYCDTECQITRHWTLPNFGYGPISAGTLKPRLRRTCGCTQSKQSKLIDVEVSR